MIVKSYVQKLISSAIVTSLFFSYIAIAENNKVAPKAVLVEVATVQAKPLERKITVTGSLRANQGVTVSSEIPGRITQIYFQSGSKVAANAPLVQLNKSVLEAQLMQSKARLGLAKLNYGRMLALIKTKVISQADFDASRSAFNTAESEVAQYQAQLDQTLIKAPFAGKLGLSAVNVGDYVTAGQQLVKLESINPIEVEFSVPEVYLSKLSIGQNVNIISDAYKDQIFNGTIYAIDSTVNLNNRTIAVRATIPNPEEKLVSGAFVTVTIDMSTKANSLLIPQIAILYDSGVTYVYKIVDQKAVKAAISLGDRDNTNVEVVRGLNKNDVIVTAGQLSLYDGVLVTTQTDKK